MYSRIMKLVDTEESGVYFKYDSSLFRWMPVQDCSTGWKCGQPKGFCSNYGLEKSRSNPETHRQRWYHFIFMMKFLSFF